MQREIPCDVSGPVPYATTKAKSVDCSPTTIAPGYGFDMAKGSFKSRIGIESGRIQYESICRPLQRCSFTLAISLVARNDISQNARIYTRHATA